MQGKQPHQGPERSRLRLLAIIGMGLLLSASRAQCSLFTGDTDDEDDEDDAASS